MRIFGFFVAYVIFILTCNANALNVAQLETKAKGAILIDYSSGKILYEKNIKDRVFPASTVKIMTSYIVFESLASGAASLEDTIVVSKNAFTKGGFNTGSSTMFLNNGEQITLHQALQGMIVQSGNDATISIAEHLKGSEESFVNYMNQVAYRFNLENTNFINSTGWPDPNQYTTLEDITIIARNLIRDFPEYYHYFSQKSFEHNGISQGNRNSLLFMSDVDVDGVKTGHTKDSGYVLVFSGVVNDFRYVGAVYGLDSAKARTLESKKIIKWAENNLTSKTLYKKGEKITDINIWYSKNSANSIKAPYDIKIVYPKSAKGEQIKVDIDYKNNIVAPIAKGTLAAVLKVGIEGKEDYLTTHNIYFTEDIAKDMPWWKKVIYTPIYIIKKLIFRFS